MSSVFRTVLFLPAVSLAARAADAAIDLAAETRAERAKLHETFADVFAPVVDDPRLPRVLLIGDSISIGYTVAVRAQLRDIANVHRIPDNGGPTTRGRAMLDEWLGDGRWDVVHFNFGLHDIARVKAGGAPRVTAAEYEGNLRAIATRLRATGARLIGATTTPVPPVEVRPVRRNEDVVERNAIVRRVMAELRVPLDDLYAVATPRLAAIQQPANVHFTPQGYAVLADAVVASLRAELSKAPGAKR